MSVARSATALAAGLREYARTPVLLALLVGLPAYLLVVFGWVAPDTRVALSLPGGGTATAGVDAVYVALLAPMTAALVCAVAGLFATDTARDADGRLVVAGYRPRELLAARAGLVLVVALVVTDATLAATFLTPFSPAHLPLFVAATVAAGLCYGLLGVLAGLVVGRLTGVYLVLFGTLLDLFLLQNPLAEPTPLAALLPGYGPVRGAVAAGFGNGDPATLAPALAATLVAALLALGALSRSMTRP